MDELKITENHLVKRNSTSLSIQLTENELLKAKDYQISIKCAVVNENTFITQECSFGNKVSNGIACACYFLEPSTRYALSFNISKAKLGLGYEYFFRNEITSEHIFHFCFKHLNKN